MNIRKIALITGGGSWIGKAIATALLKTGCIVYIAGRDEQKLKNTCQELRNISSDIHYFVYDANSLFSTQSLTDVIASNHGKLDILIANAAIYPSSSIDELELNQWQQVIDVNLTGSFLLFKLTHNLLKQSSCGRIISISSVAGEKIGVKNLAAYCASKAGLNGLIRACALEYAEDKITVNAILPGNICNVQRFNISPEQQLKMLSKIPLGRLGTPDDIAAMTCFLASEQAGFITGQMFVIDGGECIQTGER